MYTYINICTHAHPSVMYKTDNDRSALARNENSLPPPLTRNSLFTPSSRPTQMQCDILLSFQQQKNGRRGTAALAYTPRACAHRCQGADSYTWEKQMGQEWLRLPSLSPIKLSAPYASGQKITKFAEHHWFLGFGFFILMCVRNNGLSPLLRSQCRGQRRDLCLPAGLGTGPFHPPPTITRWR